MKNFYFKIPLQFYFTLILLLFSNLFFSQTTYTVTNTGDEGTGTLREAITLANQSISRDSIHFDIEGDGPNIIYLNSSLPEIVNPVLLDATTQTGYSYKSPQVIIDGKENEIIVFHLSGGSSGSLIKGFLIHNLGLLGDRKSLQPYTIGSLNLGTAIYAKESGDHIFQENLLGKIEEKLEENDSIFSLRYGIILENSTNNLIGGENMGNVISGSEVSGITIVGLESTNNLILGNFVGTNTEGLVRKPNFFGITIGEQSQYNTIGGNNAKKRNIISGNYFYGVRIAGSRNKVIGNFVGLDAAGGALGNRRMGIAIVDIENSEAIENMIGGFGPGERNIISANKLNNVLIAYASKNEIKGNYIGTDTLGTKELMYSEDKRQVYGFRIDNAENNLVSGNLISGNVIGISITSESRFNRILGNLIGTNAMETAAIPNETGIRIANTSYENVIGGLESEDSNIIAYNTLSGILMKKYSVLDTPGSFNNKFSGNSIYANGSLGIDLSPDGITENDPDDSDTGQNNLQNFPEIKNQASLEGNILRLEYRVPSSPQYSAYPITVEFFKSDGNRQGKEYLGKDIYKESDISKGRKGKSISLELIQGNTLNGGDKVLGTATDANGNTSEFGAEIDVTGGCTETLWYADKDGDGLGDPNDSLSSCTQPEGYISNSDDCDDTNPDIKAGTLWYADVDADGFGDFNVTKTACVQPEGFVANSDDCDDTDATVHPDATDVCKDCNAATDTEDCEAPVECVGTDVLTLSEVCTDSSNVHWVLNNPGTCSVEVRWESRKTNESGVITALPGDAFFSTKISSRGPTQVTIYWPDSNGNETKISTNASGIACASSAGLTSSFLEANHNDTEAGLKIYPNPITDEGIWLHFSEKEFSSIFKISAYDLGGRKMAETTLEVDAKGSHILWDVNHGKWMPGIYIINASNGNQVYQVKIMK